MIAMVSSENSGDGTKGGSDDFLKSRDHRACGTGNGEPERNSEVSELNRGQMNETADCKTGIDLKREIQTADEIELRSITSTADDGKYHAKLKVYYDPAQLVIKDDYSPTSCMEAALSIDEDKADGSYKCTKMAGGLQPDAGNSTNGEDLCVKLNSLHVCESKLVQSGSYFRNNCILYR